MKAGGDNELEQKLAHACKARASVVQRASNDHLITVLSGAARSWARRDFDPRMAVTARLAEHLAIHPGMLDRGLDHLFASVDEPALRRLLAEAEDPAALEPTVARAGEPRPRLAGPPIVFHALAGNVPGLAIAPIVASVLARSVAIIRDSARQPWLTEAFLATLAEHDAEVAAMVVPVWWEAGDLEHERRALELAARAEIYGSERTLNDLRSRHPDVRAEIVERGTRLSAGIVTAEASFDHAGAFAEDIVLYEGLGCLSPHAILVEGDREHALAFARQLGAALETYERCWPRRARSVSLEAERRTFIDDAHARSLGAAGEHLLSGTAAAWALHVTETAPLEVGPGLRCARVIACTSRDRVLEILAAAPAPLAAIGVAGAEPAASGHSNRSVSPSDHSALEGALCSLGATLVCEPGRMQAPPITWRQDGRRRLGDLLSWREAGR